MAHCDAFSFASFSNYYPPFIPRTDISRYFPWLSQKRLANLASTGHGPPAFKNGRAVIYPTREFLLWLDSRTQALGKSVENSQAVRDVCQGNNSPLPVFKKRRGRKSKAQEVRERRGM